MVTRFPPWRLVIAVVAFNVAVLIIAPVTELSPLVKYAAL